MNSSPSPSNPPSNPPSPPSCAFAFLGIRWSKVPRVLILHGIVAGLMAALCIRLFCLQVYARQTFISKALRQQMSEEGIRSRPGDLFDRQGRLLATTISVPSLYVNPAAIPESDRPHLAIQLGAVLNQSSEALLKKFEEHAHRQFLWVRRRLTDEEAAAVRELKLSTRQAGLRREFQRVYPQGTLAAHVLGLRNIDGLGRGGVEEHFDSILRGQDGIRRFVRDARGYVLDVLEEVTQPPVDGHSLTLTIDLVVQMQLERQLDAAMENHHAKGACGIAIDPQTGEILALASRPTFDPNRPERARPEDWKNLATAAAFEPGSTFKPMVVAWGLERNLIQRDDQFDCEQGTYRMGSRVLHDHHPYGVLSLTDVLVKSSNIGMAKIGERLTNRELNELARSFGFGTRTGIELPGELSGFLRPLKEWTSYSTGSIPMGHEFTATPIQILAAYAILANGGERIAPHLLLRKTADSMSASPLDQLGRSCGREERLSLNETLSFHEPGRHRHDETALVKSRILEKETADWVVSTPLVEVVRRGTGRQANLPGLAVFGKTGTAQKLHESGSGYSSSRHYSSFIGGGTAENPRLVVLISVDEPQGTDQFGGSVAAPYVAEVLKQHLDTRQTQSLPEKPAR